MEKMERNPKSLAKIEEPNRQLPKSLPNGNSDPWTSENCYVKIFDTKPKHLAQGMAKGTELHRKVYRIRNMELFKAVGEAFEDMQKIHKVSEAKIGLIVDGSDHHAHSFLEVTGTVEQIKMAEELILDKILQTYEGPGFPVILMPPTLYGHETKLHMTKVARLLEKNGSNVLALEIVSGAWLQVDDQPPARGPNDERKVYIYGPKANVFKALSLIHAQVYEHGECPEAEEELNMLFEELSCVEEGMKSHTLRMVDVIKAASASASGSGSGQSDEEKEQRAEDAKDKDKSKGKIT